MITPTLAIALAVFAVAVVVAGLLLARAERMGRTPEQVAIGRKILAAAGIAAVMLVFIAIFMPDRGA